MIEYEKSRKELTEREFGQYRKKVDKRRIDSFVPKNERTQSEIQRVYENGRRTGKGRTRKKSKIKKVSFDAREYSAIIAFLPGNLIPHQMIPLSVYQKYLNL